MKPRNCAADSLESVIGTAKNTVMPACRPESAGMVVAGSVAAGEGGAGAVAAGVVGVVGNRRQ
jgi:hypothetical protein